MPFRLAAFADEISADIQVQMDYLLEAGIVLCALRGANGKDALEFEDFQVPIMKKQFQNRKISFACYSSPLGRTSVNEPFEPELERFKLACKRAKQFDTRVLGLSSFRLPEGDDPAVHRDEVLRRLKALAEQANAEGCKLLLENEPAAYGNCGERCAELFKALKASNMMCAFDFADFVQAGEDPWTAWQALKPWVKDFRLKDLAPDGAAALPGQGAGKIQEILADAFANRWAGLLTVAPQLDRLPEMEGRSNGERFLAAVSAAKELLKTVGAA
jgi:sugar phosphate isomerase/epimerase